MALPWALSPLGTRHALDVDEVGRVSVCGRWRPAPHDVRDGDGPRCPACVMIEVNHGEPAWSKRNGQYYSKRSTDIAEKLLAHMPPLEIAAELGVSLNHVHKVAQRMRDKDALTRLTMHSRIRAMAAEHPTWLRSAIARELGTTMQQVAKVLGGGV
jgi:hypothetical protein